SAPLRISSAARFPASGVAPTVQTPTSPPVADDAYGSRRFIGFAPSRCAAIMNASTYSARSSPCERTMSVSPSATAQSSSSRAHSAGGLEGLGARDAPDGSRADREHVVRVPGQREAVEPLVQLVEQPRQGLRRQIDEPHRYRRVPVLADVLHVERHARQRLALVPLAPQLAGDLGGERVSGAAHRLAPVPLEPDREGAEAVDLEIAAA